MLRFARVSSFIPIKGYIFEPRYCHSSYYSRLLTTLINDCTISVAGIHLTALPTKVANGI